MDGGTHVCPGAAVPPIQQSCPSGEDPFASQTVDLVLCTDVGNANIAFVAPDGVPYSGVGAVSDPTTGAFAVCLPEDHPFTAAVTAAQYPTTYYAEFDGVGPNQASQIPLIGLDELNALASLIPGGPTLNEGLLIVKVTSTALCHAATSGWSFSLDLPDGGEFPDGGYQIVYMGSTFVPDATATSTSTEGAAVIYNIDDSISNFVVPIAQPPASDADCLSLNSYVGLTGRIYVAANSVSLFSVVLP